MPKEDRPADVEATYDVRGTALHFVNHVRLLQAFGTAAGWLRSERAGDIRTSIRVMGDGGDGGGGDGVVVLCSVL
jgi:hypothetical protein